MCYEGLNNWLRLEGRMGGRGAMSGSLFSSEVRGRALVFLLSQSLLFTILQQSVQTSGVILINAAAQNTSITACLI